MKSKDNNRLTRFSYRRLLVGHRLMTPTITRWRFIRKFVEKTGVLLTSFVEFWSFSRFSPGFFKRQNERRAIGRKWTNAASFFTLDWSDELNERRLVGSVCFRYKMKSTKLKETKLKGPRKRKKRNEKKGDSLREVKRVRRNQLSCGAFVKSVVLFCFAGFFWRLFRLTFLSLFFKEKTT